jgi:hypothetical protein
MKITRLKDFELQNFLDIDSHKYDEYRRSSDYKKLVKISKDYFERYSTELSLYWQGSSASTQLNQVNSNQNKNNKSTISPYKESIEEVTKSIEFLLESLEAKCHFPSENEEEKNEEARVFIESSNKDIIILDYLITCKQLLEMIEKDIKLNGCENYEKFAKKSRIEEIVEGSTTDISMDLYEKIS